MNSRNNYPSQFPFAVTTLVIFVLLLVALQLFCGCTITPGETKPTEASFDQGGQNSGFLGWTNADQSTVGILTSHAHDRYNALIAIYGKKFSPPLNMGKGTQQIPGTSNWMIMRMDLVNFETMNRWKKEGKK